MVVKKACFNIVSKQNGFFFQFHYLCLFFRLCQASGNNNAAFTFPDSNLNLSNPFEDKDNLSPGLRNVLTAFERQYLSRSLSRLEDS